MILVRETWEIVECVRKRKELREGELSAGSSPSRLTESYPKWVIDPP